MLLNPNTQVFPSEPRLYGTSKKTNHRLKKYHPVRARLYHEDTFDHIDLLPRVKAAASAMFQKHNEYKKDQLPGGKLWDPDDATKAIVTQLKPHNDSSESILGYIDWLTTALPNLSQQTLSALTEVTYNKTVDWLNSQPDEKQQEVMDLAVSERRTLQKARKEHEKQIKNAFNKSYRKLKS